MFTGHPSLRCGGAVHLMEAWRNNPNNAIFFTGQFCLTYHVLLFMFISLQKLLEPDFDYLHALAPFQPINMKVKWSPKNTNLIHGPI